METTYDKDDVRYTLDDAMRDRGLIRRNQYKKLTKDEREKYVEETFDWGNGTVRGYKKDK